MKRKSINNKLYRFGFVISSIAILALFTLGAMMYEYCIEEAYIDQYLLEETTYFLEHIDPDQQSTINTKNIVAFYSPDEHYDYRQLPASFKNIPEHLLTAKPRNYLDSGEDVDSDNDAIEDEFIVNSKIYKFIGGKIEHGVFAVILDITLIESLESLLLTAFSFVSVLLLLLSILVIRIVSKLLSAPLRKLSQSIHITKPGSEVPDISTSYNDIELYDIAHSFNLFLLSNNAYINRERSLIRIASHELRTPLAIIQGAIDVISKRDNLNNDDAITIDRAKVAINEAKNNIDTILKLTRNEVIDDINQSINFNTVFEQVNNDFQKQGLAVNRIENNINGDFYIKTNQYLMISLVRNLLQNALDYSDGPIIIRQHPSGIEILSSSFFDIKSSTHSGLGLFIASLICNRLNWQLEQSSNNFGVLIKTQ